MYSNDDLVDFVENASVGLHWVDADGIIVWANEAELRLLGYTREEYVGRHIAEFHVDGEVIADMLKRLSCYEILHQHEARLRAKDGSIKHVVISSSVYRRDGKFVHTRCFTQDATEGKNLWIRTRRLREFATELSHDLKIVEIARSTVLVGLEALAATSGMVALLTTNHEVELCHSVGYLDESIRPWRTFPLETPVPITEAIRTASTVVVSGSEIEARYPLVAAASTFDANNVFISVPMMVEGTCIGGIGFTVPGNRCLTAGVREYLEDVGQQCGLAIRRSQLADRNRVASHRLEILADASRAFAANSQDLDGLVQTVGQHVISAFGGSCDISLLAPNGLDLEPRFVFHEDDDAAAALKAMLTSYPRQVGEGVVGKVAETGVPVFVADVANAGSLNASTKREYRAFLARHPVHSLIIVPLSSSGRVLGTIAAARYVPGSPYTESDKRLLEDLADRAAVAIDNVNLYQRERTARQDAEDAAKRTRQLQMLTSALTAAQSSQDVASALVKAACEALAASASFAWLLAPDRANLVLVSSRGYEGPRLENFRQIPLDAPLPVCEAIRARQPVLFANIGEMEDAFPASAQDGRPSPFKSWAVFPLLVSDQSIGGVSLSFAEERSFDDADRELLINMGAQAAQAFERCRLFDAEKAARARAEEADRRKDEFLAILGHELRNPLAPIQTALQLARLRGDQSGLRERSIIERQVGHLERLIDDLLDMSRITQGRLDLKKEHVEIGAVVAKAIEQAEPLVEQLKHRLDVAVPSSGLRVEGDQVRLAQVVTNLLTNAAKYTQPGGTIALSASREGETIVLRVRDNGAGIEPDVLPRLFELFAQAPQTLDRSRGGLGLGLAIVRRLVDLHGGTVEARSDGLGRGSEFIVRLPAAPAAQGADCQPASTAQSHPRVGESRRILIVDDNVDAAVMLAEALSLAGHDVNVAHDGPRALTAASSFRPDTVLLDIGLPVMDGYEVAQRLRLDPTFASKRIIALTGYGQDKDRVRIREAGFDEHLVKPVDLERLLTLLE